MDPEVFLAAAKNINDFVSPDDCTGQERYICHALNVELEQGHDDELPTEYKEIVELFHPTEAEYALNGDTYDRCLWYGYFGSPNSRHQAERIIACLFMYWIARDKTK